MSREMTMMRAALAALILSMGPWCGAAGEILPGLESAQPVVRATRTAEGQVQTDVPREPGPADSGAAAGYGMVAEQGARPAPAATDGKVPAAVFEWPTGKKLVALTYDDGPHPTITPRLIALLKEKKVKATFYLLGEQVKAYPKVAALLNDPDFEVANHSWNHPQLTKLSAEAVRSQLSRTEDEIKKATGLNSKTMRPPYGSQNATVRQVCAELGLRVVNWDVDTNDWRKRPASVMTNFIMENTGDGSIILFHDRYEASLESTAEVIDRLRAKGYEFVTVSELLAHPMVEAKQVAAPKSPETPAKPARKETRQP